MALFHSWTLLVRGRVGPATIALVLGVTVWWVLILGAVGLVVPAPDVAGKPTTVAFVPGHLAHIYAPRGDTKLIPVDRAAYVDAGSTVVAIGGQAFTQTPARPGWITVLHGQAVQILTMDGDAAHVEVVEDPGAGDRGWLNVDHLRP